MKAWTNVSLDLYHAYVGIILQSKKKPITVLEFIENHQKTEIMINAYIVYFCIVLENRMK